MDKSEAYELLQEVLDALVKAENGITKKKANEAADKLFKFRDEYFDNSVNETKNPVVIND